MLKHRSIWSVSTLADCLNQNGVTLQPMIATPLKTAMDECHSPFADNSQYVDANDVSSIVEGFAQASTLTDAGGVSTHCQAVGEVREITKKALEKDLYIARNLVSPIARAVAEDVAAFLKQRENQFANVLAVVPDSYDQIWDSPIFLDMFKQYETSPAANDVKAPTAHPPMTPTEIIEMMKTGSTRFDDKDLAGFIESVGEDVIQRTYDTYFAAKSDENSANGYVPRVDLLASRDPLTRKQLVIAHLLARRFARDTIPGIQMDSRAYESNINGFLQQTGRLLCRQVEDRESTKRGMDIVKFYPFIENAEFNIYNPDWSQIVVYMDLYNKWLDKGGCPEILFGAAITDQEKNGEVLLQKAEYYKQVWEIRATTIQQMVRNQHFTNSIIGLRTAVAKQINALADEMIPEGSREPLHKRLEDVLKTVTIHCLAEPILCARDVVIRAMFPHTNAKLVMDTIDAIAKDNPNLPLREVALLASIRILARWYVGQMQIQKKR